MKTLKVPKVFAVIGIFVTALVVFRNERNLISVSLRELEVHVASQQPTRAKESVSLETIANTHENRTATTMTTTTKLTTTKMNQNNSFPIIDLISIGSIFKADWQDAQLRTFASHASVRQYFRINEHNDTDKDCSTNFTNIQLAKVIQFCNNTDINVQSFDSMVMRKRLFWPKRHTGWLCAQKRPIDGLYLALKSYDETIMMLPSFLIIMDDDTYIHMDQMIDTTFHLYDWDEPHVVAGCRFTYPRKIQFAFPYGGFGTFLTRAAIARLLEPITCDETTAISTTTFVQWACWRLEQNVLGERSVFRSGMSLADLMYSYAAAVPFTSVEEWKNPMGFCLHSDHALGYFFNYYHLSVPTSVLEKSPFSDQVRMEYSYEFLLGGQECEHEKNSCLPEHRLCHYLRPDRMDEIYAYHRRREQG